MTVGPLTSSSPAPRRAPALPAVVGDDDLTPAIGVPIGISLGRSRLGARHLVPGAHVRLGRAVEVAEARLREELHQPARYFVGNTSPAKRTVRSAGSSASCEPAAQHEHREDRRDRVPDRDRASRMKRASSTGNTDSSRGTSTTARAGRRRGEEVEHREVEVEAARGSRGGRPPPTPNSLGRPVDERERVPVREHHALRLARRARRVEDVGEASGVDRGRRGDRPDAPSSAHATMRSPVRGASCSRSPSTTTSVSTGAPPRPARLQSEASRARSHEAADAGVSRDVGEPRRRRLVVERHVGRAGLEDRRRCATTASSDLSR